MDRRLGRPLPHQLPNPTRADPLAINLSSVELIRHYSQFPRAIPNQRARSHALLTRPPLGPKTSLDLHVLSLPPAFVLSQDQTLKLKRVWFALPLRYLERRDARPVLDVRTSAHHPALSSQIKRHRLLRASFPSRITTDQTNGEADTPIIDSRLEGRYANVQSIEMNQTAHISLHHIKMSKSNRQHRWLASLP